MPAAIDALTKAFGGAAEHGASVGIKQNTAEAIDLTKNALVTAEAVLDEAKTEMATRTQALRNVVKEAATFIILARDMLKPTLGTTYSTAWDAVGFVGTLQLRRNPAGIQFVLQKLKAYLELNVGAQSVEKNITPTRVQELIDSVVVKVCDVALQRAVVSRAVADRQVKLKAAMMRISNLVAELRGLVSPTDAIYGAFGLNMPGAKATPEVPESVTVKLMEPRKASVTWQKSPGADHYRLWKRVAGVDAEMVLVTTREECDFVFEDLPMDKTIELGISALNSGGESQRANIVLTTSAKDNAMP